MDSKEKRIEKITNRVLINVGVGILAYLLLWVLFTKLYMPNVTTFAIAGVFALTGAAFYVLYRKKKLPLRNYAYMFFAFCGALLFTKLSNIVTAFIGMEKCKALTNVKFFKVLLNSSFEVKVVAVIGAVYLAAMLVYSGIRVNMISKEKNVRDTKNKKKR